MAETWKVVGGAGTGGVLVRLGKELSSALEKRRLATGSIVEQLDIVDGRLRYILISGSGPSTGWVSIKLKLKELLVQVQSGLTSEFSKPAPETVSKRLQQGNRIATFAMG
jgi:hypothetical protein